MMVWRLPYLMKGQTASERLIFSNMMETFTIWARSEDSRFGTRNAGFSGFNGQGGVMDLIRYDKPADCILQGYAWYNSSEKKIEHADGGLYSYYEPCKLEHKGALTVYFSMDETSAEKTIAAGEDVYCIRSDGDGWMYVRAKDGTEGFLPVTQM